MTTSGRIIPAAAAIAALVAGMLACARPAFAQESKRTTTKATMRGIFQSLTSAYSYSMDTQAFEDPANHERILSALRALADDANSLEQHGGGLDASFGYLRRSLAKDANDALQRFKDGHYMGARFMLTRLTENCVTCHSRIPRRETFDVGGVFLEKARIENLPPVERVNIEIATRQFETALDTYEKIFAAADMTPARLTLIGAFEGYLKVCLGVLNDTERPVRAFTAFNKRVDMPSNLKALVTGWSESLKKLKLERAKGKELAVARRLIGDAKVQRRFPSDRRGLVDFVAATTLLHRYLRSGPSDKADIAESYYLLAVAESCISRSFWISETDFLLERAIREAPKSPYARKAYDFLEEYTLSGHMGRSRDVPADVRANLAALRGMIED
ncbi:MAG: hypothetical protein ACE5EO_12090 [Candidatus Krumholzibacteriia bacterium]